MRALFCEIIKAHHYAIILIFLCCFGIYSDFSYFFSQFFQLLGWFLEAVLVIFAVSATFLAIFPAFGLNFGCCFKRFKDYSSPRSAYYVINQSSPNLCVNSSSSYISPSMLPLSSGDLIEWSLVCHSILSYQKFCD